MDVHTLGSSLDDQREGIAAATSISILLEVSGHHTGGVTWSRKTTSGLKKGCYFNESNLNLIFRFEISVSFDCDLQGRLVPEGLRAGLQEPFVPVPGK